MNDSLSCVTKSLVGEDWGRPHSRDSNEVGSHPQRNQELIANEYIKGIYLNYGERCEDINDHRSSIHNLSSCDIKA